VLCADLLEHSLGLLFVSLHSMALALVKVFALAVDENLLILALALGLPHHVPGIKKKMLLFRY
jgi:hypothetical protein